MISSPPSLFDLPTPNPKHPAKYTDSLLLAFVKMLKGRQRVLDPFGGTGKIFLINKWLPDLEIRALELESEWARINKRIILGNALYMPWKSDSFDSICTSPTYGNAMAKVLLPNSKWKKDHKTITYSSFINRRLHPDNSGAMLWGNKYRDFHKRAWIEATRVLARGGSFILNIKNHILDGEEQKVTEWHKETLSALGYREVESVKINTPSMRFGRSGEKRVEFESVIHFILECK